MDLDEARLIAANTSAAQLEQWLGAMRALDLKDYFSGYFEYVDVQLDSHLDRMLDEFLVSLEITPEPTATHTLSALARTVYRGHAADLILKASAEDYHRRMHQKLLAAQEEVISKITRVRKQLTANKAALGHPGIDPQSARYRHLREDIVRGEDELHTLQDRRAEFGDMTMKTGTKAVIAV